MCYYYFTFSICGIFLFKAPLLLNIFRLVLNLYKNNLFGCSYFKVLSKKQDALKDIEDNKLNKTNQSVHVLEISTHKNPGTDLSKNPSNIPMNDDKNISTTDHAIIVNIDRVIDSDMDNDNSDILHFKMDDSSDTRIGRILWIVNLVYSLKSNSNVILKEF